VYLGYLPLEKLETVILEVERGCIDISFFDADRMLPVFEATPAPIKGATLSYFVSMAEGLTSGESLFGDIEKEVEKSLFVSFNSL
jgi:hypothetical protein